MASCPLIHVSRSLLMLCVQNYREPVLHFNVLFNGFLLFGHFVYNNGMWSHLWTQKSGTCTSCLVRFCEERHTNVCLGFLVFLAKKLLEHYGKYCNHELNLSLTYNFCCYSYIPGYICTESLHEKQWMSQKFNNIQSTNMCNNKKLILFYLFLHFVYENICCQQCNNIRIQSNNSVFWYSEVK